MFFLKSLGLFWSTGCDSRFGSRFANSFLVTARSWGPLTRWLHPKGGAFGKLWILGNAMPGIFVGDMLWSWLLTYVDLLDIVHTWGRSDGTSQEASWAKDGSGGEFFWGTLSTSVHQWRKFFVKGIIYCRSQQRLAVGPYPLSEFCLVLVSLWSFWSLLLPLSLWATRPNTQKVGLNLSQMICGLEIVSCPGFQTFLSPRPPDMSCSKPDSPARDLRKLPQNYKAGTNEPRNGDLWRLSLVFRGKQQFVLSFKANMNFLHSSFRATPRPLVSFQFAGAQVATNVARMLVASSTGQSLDVDSLQMRVSMAMGVPPNGGFIRKIPMKMDDDWGYPYFWKPPNERLSTKWNTGK